MDNDPNNEEYQFADIDAPGTDFMQDDLRGATEEDVAARKNSRGKMIVRNSLIVIVVFLAMMLSYKFIGSIFLDKDKTPVQPSAITALPQPVVDKVEPDVVAQAPVPVEMPVVATPASPVPAEVTRRLSALEIGQESMRSDVSSLTTQTLTLQTTVTDLTRKVDELAQTVNTLAAQIERQSEKITLLMVRKVPPRPVHRVKRHVVPMYFIQAVIPGRAWLMATNGVSITVREGTKIEGYGRVRLIDSSQGRVLTSSGRVIEFSKQDS